MAPSLGFTNVETDRMNRKRKRTKDFNANPEDHENADGSERKQKKKKRGKEDLTVELVELVAKYLSKRGLSKTLAALISESQCKNTWEIQTLDLEDIYSNFSNQNREKVLKHKAEERNLEQANDALLEDLGNQNEDVIFQEQGFKTKDGGIVSRKVDNAKEASSGSGALKEGLSETDKSEDSCDDDQDEHAQKKKTKKSGVGKNIKPVSDNISAKKRCLGLVIIADRKNENSTKDTTKPPKPSNESEKVLELNDSVHESLKVLTERRRKKKMTSEENDSRDNELEKVLELAEPVHGSLKAPENRRGKKMTSKDSGDNDKQSSGKKNKKGKSALKKKLQSTGSHVYEEAMEGSMKDSTGDSSKSLDNIQDPMTSQAKEVVEKDAVKSVKDSAVANKCKSGSIFGQKEGIKAEETEGNISENLKKIRKQNPDVPTAAKAFQRVKVEEVKFVDPRLQDNSYWAKGGAENGYGAKAEGVLGQVRGKDFRHEKTKKKRGSYKGGIIDLQSHSVKFNCSDEE